MFYWSSNYEIIHNVHFTDFHWYFTFKKKPRKEAKSMIELIGELTTENGDFKEESIDKTLR